MPDNTVGPLLAEVREFLADDAIVFTASHASAEPVVSALGNAGLSRHTAGPAEDSSGAWLTAARDLKGASGDREVLAISVHPGTLLLAGGTHTTAPTVALVVLALGTNRADEADSLHESGWHVQRVVTLEEVQTALAAAFASDMPAVIFYAAPS